MYESGTDRVVVIMGHTVDLNRIENPQLRRVIQESVTSDDFLFRRGKHTDEKKHSDYRDYTEYKDHIDHREKYHDKYRDYVDY